MSVLKAASTQSTATDAISLGIPRKPQCIASRCGLANTTYRGSQSGHTDLRFDYRYNHFVGPQAVSQLQIAQAGFTLTATGEASLGNDFNYEADIELTTPVTAQPFYFNNSIVGTVVNGHGGVFSDTLNGFEIAAGTAFIIRQGFSLTNIPFTLPLETQVTRNVNLVDSGVRSPSFTSQTNATGALVTPSGGNTAVNSVPFPSIVVGIPALPMPSVCIIGDSIADGKNDGDGVQGGDTSGNFGYIQRGLGGVNGFTLPYMNQTVGSWTIGNASVDKTYRMRAYWKYFTHFYIHITTNDILAGTTAVTILANLDAFCSDIKKVLGPYGKPPIITVATVAPRTTSTDNFQTAANQTPVANFASGSIRTTVNNGILSRAGNGTVDFVANVNTVWEDPNNLGKWVTNGTSNYPSSDGTHPSQAFCILGATVVNPIALKYVA